MSPRKTDWTDPVREAHAGSQEAWRGKSHALRMPLRGGQSFFFPVAEGPIAMRPGLFRLGTDFGNPEADGATFIRDEHEARYLMEKRRLLLEAPERVGLSSHAWHRAAQEGILAWMMGRLGISTSRLDEGDLPRAVRDVSVRMAEDFAILGRSPHSEPRISLVSVCFPSGWTPESILGQTFSEVHSPVPAFDGVMSRANSLAEAMIERGPYVRFVWTLSPDAELDHHPKRWRSTWENALAGWLRVERQVTVPFPRFDSSLFLIRTFLYPFNQLSTGERARLASALRCTPTEILRYKGLYEAREHILALLERAVDRSVD